MYNTIAENNNLIKVDAIGFYFRFTMWAEFEVYYSSQKRLFFWLEDEGCSCWELGEDMKILDELCNGDKRAAAEAARHFVCRQKARAEEGFFEGNFETATVAEKILTFNCN
jgi:hypothetical protein